MILLVTGGLGFIGSNFIHYWSDHYPGDQIINLDKLTYAGHLESLRDVSGSANYRFVKGDIADPKIMAEVMPGVEVVVNFAGESHVDRSILRSTEFIHTNVVGTQVLLDACLKYHTRRYHHISTDEVFGDLPINSRSRFSEITPYAPHSPYSASKAASDFLVRAYYYTHGLPITITNCSNNYGPFHDPEKFIPRAITNLLSGQKIKIYGTGNNIRDWLHVLDHCWAIDLVVHNGRSGETYCVGGQKKLFTNLEIARKILKLMDEDDSRIEFVKDRPGHDAKYAVNWDKIHKEIRWSPKYDLDDGLKQTIEWYTQNTWWWQPLKSRAESIYHE